MNYAGRWVNTRNSILKLTQAGDKISGTFDSGVDDGGIREVPVTGWADGDRISFTTLYKAYGTIVAWVGQVIDEPGNPKIVSQSLHISDIADPNEPTQLWMSTRTGQDVFEKK